MTQNKTNLIVRLFRKSSDSIKVWMLEGLQGLGRPNEIHLIRNRLFEMVKVFSLYIMTPITLYGAYLFLKADLPLLALTEGMIPVILIILYNLRVVPASLQKAVTFGLYYVFSLFLIIFWGPQGAGMISLTFVFVLALAILSNLTNRIMIALNLLVFLVLTVLLEQGTLSGLGIAAYGAGWGMRMVMLHTAIITTYFLWSFIFARLGAQIDRFFAAVTGSNDGLWYWNIETGENIFSVRWLAQLGYGEGDLKPELQAFRDLVHPEDRERNEAAVKANMEGETPILDIELRMRHKDGSYHWMRSRGAGIHDAQGHMIAMAGSQTDITERKAQEEALQASEAKYRMITENSADMIWVLNMDKMCFTYVSPSSATLRGFQFEEIAEMPLDKFFLPENYGQVLKQLTDNRQIFLKDPSKEHKITGLIKQFRKDGTHFWSEYNGKYRLNDRGQVEVVGVSRDVTERKLKEEQIQFLSFYDPLTGLLNRNSLRILVTDLDNRKPAVRPHSVLALDIDNFKVVNDAIGQSAGDAILRELAEQIKASIDDRGSAYYIGADEFIILCETADEGELANLATDLTQAIGRQIRLKDRLFFLSTSIGQAKSEPGITQEEVLRRSNTALYVAKRRRNCIVPYENSMAEVLTRDTILKNDMQRALDQDEFFLQYQPILHTQSGEVRQAEALVRWKHPDLGLIMPGEFIPIAEANKLIIPLTQKIIRQGAQQLRAWETQGLKDLVLNLNLSIISLDNRGSDLLEHLEKTVRETGIPASRLKLEITESSFMHNPEAIITLFHQLKQAGHRLALDDFGSGYSSFGYIKDLPIDALKLDRTLVRDLISDPREQIIVRSIIEMAHRLDLHVIAEFVETKAQLELLKSFGCDYIQGYYYSKPLDPEALAGYVLNSLREPV